MDNKLRRKVEHAKLLLQKADKQAFLKGQVVEIAYSGGKDSDVILELARMAGIRYEAIYKNTTLDPPNTIKHCKKNGVTILRPKERFFQLVRKRGFPSRFSRFCCGYLKEYKVYDVAVMGIRRCESSKRAEMYKEPTACRFYGSKKNHVEVFYPILEWSDQDVVDFIKARKLKVHPLYYDEDGVFHVERRLGCICCPLASRKKRLAEFEFYPNMVKAYCMAGQYFLDTHAKSPRLDKYDNAYEWLVCQLFTDSYDEFQQRFKQSLFKVDCKQYLEEYFNIKF